MAQYWLMKSEPDVYSIDHLAADKTTLWEGVRNYQARNFMVNEMEVGDPVLFYHSNAKPPGVAGVASIAHKAIVDPTQFDKKSPYYDPRATEDTPRWYCVRVAFKQKFNKFVPLSTLKQAHALRSLQVIQRGQRLSIQKVSAAHFEHICQMGL